MRKFVFGLILALGVMPLFAADAKADTVSDEAIFVSKINDLRASKGLPALQVNANLTAKARAWSATMAAAGKIWHSTLSDGITEDWRKLGENVGMGGSVDGLHTAFVNSPKHYENLVDPSFGYVGIGIVMSGNTIFVTESFMQMMPAKAPAVSLPVITPTTQKPAAPSTTTTKPPAPKPAAPKPAVTPVKAPVAPAASTTTTTAPPPPPAPPAATAPVDPPRAPSALLVSVLERLRSFDSVPG